MQRGKKQWGGKGGTNRQGGSDRKGSVSGKKRNSRIRELPVQSIRKMDNVTQQGETG